MTTAQVIAERVMSLPEDAQREVLDFVEFIGGRKTGESGEREAQNGPRCRWRRP